MIEPYRTLQNEYVARCINPTYENLKRENFHKIHLIEIFRHLPLGWVRTQKKITEEATEIIWKWNVLDASKVYGILLYCVYRRIHIHLHTSPHSVLLPSRQPSSQPGSQSVMSGNPIKWNRIYQL